MEVAQIKSKKFKDKIQDSSLTAIARKGAKLKESPSVFADLIIVFDEDKEVIILEYLDGYYEICEGSFCGYMSEIWLKSNNSISEYVKSRTADKRLETGVTTSPRKYSSLSKSKKSSRSKSTYSTKKYRTYKSYYRGPKGGCYYINSNGNKTYVARSLCN